MSIESIRIAVPTRGHIDYRTVRRLQELRDANPGLSPVLYEAGRLGVSNVRNVIARGFLADEAKPAWLIMVDDDVTPPMSLLELASNDELDVVGYPYLILRAEVNLPFPAVFRWNEERQAHHPIEQPFGQTGRVTCDALGTGCIAIHRRVLEAIKAPFAMEYDEDGVMVRSDDIAFCKRAREAGFSITADFGRLADHSPLGVSMNLLHSLYTNAFLVARQVQQQREARRIIIPGAE